MRGSGNTPRRCCGKIHQQFIEVVRQGRGRRLKEGPDTYSGLVWTGQRSIELGLADALGSVDYVAREIIKAEKIVDFTPREILPSASPSASARRWENHWCASLVRRRRFAEAWMVGQEQEYGRSFVELRRRGSSPFADAFRSYFFSWARQIDCQAEHGLGLAFE